ncbi:peptidoglycan-binding domain-containing protein [uncultured Cohaesibacter sp.]|uniref:peptidoglycan-binding domain-containing protein n=1 Tax=uncultured Cohaesibacter sp. TaxID=1002546 RepID=UPI00292FE2BE|nr:peptidoglycan-binding domain-containing protein [uncultured Cohaesibacter sp.]
MSETYDDYEDWEEEGKRSPLALVGILVMAFSSFAIIANALYMQPKSAEIELINSVEKLDRNAQANGTITRRPLANKTRQFGSSPDDKMAVMTRAIQQKLTDTAYYVGPIDGVEGAQTKEAISAFQDAMGMPVTGKVSTRLYDILTGRKAYDAATSDVAMTDAPKGSDAPVSEVAGDAIVLDALPRSKPANGNLKRIRTLRVDLTPSQKNVSETVASGPVPPEPIPNRQASNKTGDPTLAKVQEALKEFGYSNLEVDGVMGSRTQSAISNFQRSRGHPVTGQVNDRLLQEMMIMGFLDLG